MKVVHRLGIHPTQEDLDELRASGFPLERLREVAPNFVVVEVSESDPWWPSLCTWIDDRFPDHFVETKFSESEIRAAKWLATTSDWHDGYPQPEEDRGYLSETYDLTDFCWSCGIGLRQKAPFRLVRQPRWGRHAIVQLNWVFDEYFVKPEAHTQVFEPLGIQTRDVLDVQGQRLKGVAQLVVDELVSLDTAELPFSVCSSCGRPKFLPVARGLMPRMRSAPVTRIVKSEEWFGSGASAFREVILSQLVIGSIRSHRVRGASFIPLAGTSSTSR